jgi:hypothetical protein
MAVRVIGRCYVGLDGEIKTVQHIRFADLHGCMSSAGKEV